MPRKKHEVAPGEKPKRRPRRTFGVGNNKGTRRTDGIALSDKQLEAYQLLEAFPEEWVSPGDHGLRPSSFNYLCTNGLAEKRMFPARGYAKFKFRLKTEEEL